MLPSSTKKFSGIFVSYRREDSSGHAGRLFDRLVEHFGRERIFMDIDTIEPGEDFVTVIENAVSSCDMLIAVIGRNWLSNGSTGRLDKPTDFVRIEIATALRRDIRVIPVLVQRAGIPKPQDLPEDLVKLTRRNAVELSDVRWQNDVEQLIAVMERVLAKRAEADPDACDWNLEVEQEVGELKHAAAQIRQQPKEGGPVEERHVSQVPDRESNLATRENRVAAPATPGIAATASPHKKLMLISGAVLIVLFAATIILWGSQRDQPTLSSNINQTPAAEPSVTEQPAPATPTPTPQETIKPPVDIKLVFVPPGRFMMGSEEELIVDELPVHEVSFMEGFYMGKYEITQAQWKAVMGSNPSYFQNCDNCPVENVSWLDVQSFLKKLNESNDSFKYRLPSEAEWEYACRAGTTESYAGPVSALAWYDENSESKTHPVGSKAPNAFGLYDMHGNVWELCEDAHYANYEGAPSDGSARLKDGEGHERMARGGSWADDATKLKSGHRGWNPAKKREPIVGFRVVAVQVTN